MFFSVFISKHDYWFVHSHGIISTMHIQNLNKQHDSLKPKLWFTYITLSMSTYILTVPAPMDFLDDIYLLSIPWVVMVIISYGACLGSRFELGMSLRI